MTLAILAAYVVANIALAAWVGRGAGSDADYLVAGRRLGAGVVGVSLFATWFASESLIATSAEVARDGLAGARIEPLAYGVGLIVLGLFVAARLRAARHTTLADFLGARFGRASEALAALVIAVSGTVWAAGQLYALATLVAAQSELAFLPALVAATVAVLVYTTVGGLAGDVATDVLQGSVLALGAGLLLLLAVRAAGGIEAAVAAVPGERLRLTVPGEPLLEQLEIWFVPILGTIVAQEAIARTLAARSARGARHGALLGAGLFLLIGGVPVALGLLGPELASRWNLALGAGDAFLPSLAEALLPPWLMLLFTGALLSAILSSVDSALLAVSAVSAETGYRRLRPQASGRELLRVARLATLGAGAVAFAVAAGGSSLREIVLTASSIGSVIAVPLVLGLLTRRGGARAGALSLGTGLALLALLDWVLGVGGATLFALAGGLVAYALGALTESTGRAAAAP